VAALKQLQLSQEKAQQEAAERAERQEQQLNRLACAMASSPTPVQNPPLVGEEALKKLRDIGAVHRIPVVEGGKAVLDEQKCTPEMVNQLSITKIEHVVVALLMPLLRDVFADSGRVVCNGENFTWPPVANVSDRKPDFVISLPMFLERKDGRQPTPNTTAEVIAARAADEQLIYGVPATASLSGNAVYEAEAKRDIGKPTTGNAGNAGLGELKNYMLAHIAVMTNDNDARHRAGVSKVQLPSFIRSMLVGRKYFWLLTMDAAGGNFVRLDYGEWKDRGSFDFIRKFFELLPWEVAVKGVFDALAADHHISSFNPVSAVNDLKHAFLGQGGMGRVFRAVMDDGSHVAVKVVLPLHATKLQQEFDLLSSLQNKSLPLVRPLSFVNGAEFGAGYAMTPIGRCVRRSDFAGDDELLDRVFRSLCQLHVAGVAHGDARLANLLVVVQDDCDTLIWADMSFARENSGDLSILHDVKTLIKSCTGVDVEDSDETCTILKQYSRHVNSGDKSVGVVEPVIKAVQQLLKLQSN
jgi:hypothetical protein